MGKNMYSSYTPSGKSAFFVGNLGEYSLSDTLECGQCFRFDKIDGEYDCEYVGMAGAHFVHVAQRQRGELIFIGATKEDYHAYLCDYFSLDIDWSTVNEQIKRADTSPIMQKAAQLGCGIAILRQDIWETLFSFIVSQNNNIPRIKKNIKTVCALYGEKTGEKCEKCTECGACYTFPTAQQILSSPQLLEGAKLGFRYKYLLDAATRVANGEIDLSSVMHPAEFETAQKTLCGILGVGAKVSSCVLLFGGRHLNAFPVDVWMKRAIDEYFGGKLDIDKFGEYAGVAQQYIFHYIRNIDKNK